MKQWCTRALLYTAGLFCLAVGVALSVNSDLGVSPVNSLPYAVSVAGGWPMGRCVTVVFCLYILAQALLLRRAFKAVNLLQILFSTIFGYFVDMAKQLCAGLTAQSYPGRLALMAAGILAISAGLMLYLQADIVPMPMEGLTLAVTQKLRGVPFHRVKIILDCASVALAALVLLLATGGVSGLREGTVLAALLCGKVLALFNKWLAKPLRQVCGLPAKQAA